MAGIRKLPDQIPLAVFIGAVFDIVLIEFAGPQAEAVVMLGSQNGEGKSRRLDRLDPLADIRAGRVKDLLLLHAGAPFRIGEGIHTEVEEGLLAVIPQVGQLPFRRNCPHRCQVQFFQYNILLIQSKIDVDLTKNRQNPPPPNEHDKTLCSKCITWKRNGHRIGH